MWRTLIKSCLSFLFICLASLPVLAQDGAREPATWVTADKLAPAEHNFPRPPNAVRLTESFLSSPVALNPFQPEHNLSSPILPLLSDPDDFTLLGYRIPPNTATRLAWVPSKFFTGLDVKTPVLVVNGATRGETLCLTAAVHGDELNGIEMVRRVMFGLDPARLRGTVIGVPIVNLMAFSRNSRYLPDRRDLNRYFPGNPQGSLASRFAHAFFHEIILNCDALVDIHTGSFHRTNLMQLRADLATQGVVELARGFGDIVVLNSKGNPNSLRHASVLAGIPAVTIEAGEPLRMQKEIVQEGVDALTTLLKKRNIIDHSIFWREPAPAFYQSTWVRAQHSGILFSQVALGDKVAKGDVLGTVTNPVTSRQYVIRAVQPGKVIGMALDQFVLPGFAAYHIGLTSRTPTLPAGTSGTEENFEDE